MSRTTGESRWSVKGIVSSRWTYLSCLISQIIYKLSFNSLRCSKTPWPLFHQFIQKILWNLKTWAPWTQSHSNLLFLGTSLSLCKIEVKVKIAPENIHQVKLIRQLKALQTKANFSLKSDKTCTWTIKHRCINLKSN